LSHRVVLGEAKVVSDIEERVPNSAWYPSRLRRTPERKKRSVYCSGGLSRGGKKPCANFGAGGLLEAELKVFNGLSVACPVKSKSAKCFEVKKWELPQTHTRPSAILTTCVPVRHRTSEGGEKRVHGGDGKGCI